MTYTTPGGSDNNIQINNQGRFEGDTNLTWNGSALDITGSIILKETGDNFTESVTLQAPSTISSSFTLTLPDNDGENNDLLVSNGSGVLSWKGIDDFSVTTLVTGTKPTIYDDSSEAITTVSGNTFLRSVKIGEVVFVHIRIQWTAVTSANTGNNIRILNLPTGVRNDFFYNTSMTYSGNGLNSTYSNSVILAETNFGGSSELSIRELDNNSSERKMTINDLNSSGYILLSGFYFSTA